MKQSKKYSLNWRDVLRGLIVGSGTGVLMFLQECLAKQDWVFHWQGIGMAAIAGILTYLLKNFLTSPDA